MVSYIEKSHSKPVQDVAWLPQSTEISKKDELHKTESSHAMQFLSIAGEAKMLVYVCMSSRVYSLQYDLCMQMGCSRRP